MIEHYDIAGYCRISVDEETDRDNVSIENQKAIIEDYVHKKFTGSTLAFFEDRDRSGYTFEQRENYQAMRRELMNRKLDILIVKDFSRFARRNSRGLVELEDLRDAGVRIISIGDNIDFPNDDDWLKIQFQFLINEMPVTDTSKKVRSVVKRRQEDGKWICAAPYGYIVNKAQAFEVVPTEADIVRKIYALYNDGWGYKKIANHLTDEGIPTPRMGERDRKEAEGIEYKRLVKPVWSIVTVQGILDNDFYIGTLRQGKYMRQKINGDDVRRDAVDHYVFEHHHQAIVDYRTFAITKALREKRTTSSYRGIKINDNTYSGFLVCGDCGSPMFAMSRSDLKDAYRCGEYHKRGLKGCTSHHIRVELLDELVRAYIIKVKDSSAEMLARLNEDLAKEQEDLDETQVATENLEQVLLELTTELKATKRQRIRDMMKNPDKEEILEQTYDELEGDLLKRIEGIGNQISMTQDKRNTIIQVNRIVKTALDVFEDILKKPKLERNDLELIIEQMRIYEDRIEIQLKADIDGLLKCGGEQRELVCAGVSATSPADVASAHDSGVTPLNFNLGTEHISQITQSAQNRVDKVFRVSVISNGDPLEIFTDNDGEVIFKKYSPIGELGTFANAYADVLFKTCGYPIIVCDRDHVIAAAGVSKKEIIERRVATGLEDMVDSRKSYVYSGNEKKLQPVEGAEYYILVQYPIIAAGDVCGSVVMLMNSPSDRAGDTETKLASAAAAFLGKQMEE